MLDIAFIREHAELIKNNCRSRGAPVDVDRLLHLDDERRSRLRALDELRARRNAGSRQKPSPEEIEALRALGGEIARLEAELTEIEAEHRALLNEIPNLTHQETPTGGEEDFAVLETRGETPTFSFSPRDHEALLAERGLLDFERGAKVAGHKFFFAQGNLVRLNSALIHYGMDIAERHGYTLLETPDIAKDSVIIGAGFQPRGPETQIYSLEGEQMSLIGTAEITTLGYHAGEILDLSGGPKKYASLSHCFRTEEGSHGRASKGLYRIHQFTKLELFVFCDPSQSEILHKELLAIEEEIVGGLGLAYRIIDVASGDLGAPAYRKFDIEAWMAMKGESGGYGEITSASNCTDYQARRLNIKYSAPDGSARLLHTLNGTAIVTSRLPIAIAEQFQRSDGCIDIPRVLRPYMGADVM